MIFIEGRNFRTIGAVDGKHVRIEMSTGSGYLFYNYRHFFSILLLALVDANYCFVAVALEQLESLAIPLFLRNQT